MYDNKILGSFKEKDNKLKIVISDQLHNVVKVLTSEHTHDVSITIKTNFMDKGEIILP